MATDPRRLLPRVDVLLEHPALREQAATWGHGPVLGAARRTPDASRLAVAGGGPVPGLGELAAAVAGGVDDLAAGTRGRRGAAAEALLREATGAEMGLVVNNAAGALLLALGGLARGREVVVSRGELIEIGGEFRLPA